MSEKKHGRVENAVQSMAEAADHPLRQAREAFGLGDAERWTVHQVQFSETARVAARRALWYLRLAEIDWDESLCRHVQNMAFGQLDPIHVPAAPDELCQPGDPDSKCEYRGAIEPQFTELTRSWNELLSTLGSPKILSYSEIRKVESDIAWFIKRSRPLDPFIRFTYSLAPAFRAGLAQHLGIIGTFLVGLLVCAGVEAVRSILMNDPSLTFVVFIAALAPIAILAAAQQVMHKRGKPAFWNIGGRVVHALPVSYQPDRWRTWHPEGYAQNIYFSLASKFGLHVALWVFLGTLLAAGISQFGWDGIWLTVYLIVMLWALLVLVGGVIDFADMHSRSPLRAMLVAGAVFVGIVLMLTDSDALTAGAVALWTAGMIWWSFRVRNKIGSNVPIVMAILVLVAIGETSARQRDAVWKPDSTKAAQPPLPLQANEWPLGDASSGPVVTIAASGGGSRAAIFTAKTLMALEESLPDIAANIQAISSVSGGSLASAAYIARRLRASNFSRDSMPLCDGPLSAAMSRDFIQPTILGLVKPGGRGRAIQKDWEQCPVGLGDVSIDKLALAWRAAKASRNARVPFPIPLFNSTTLERNAVVITPLDQQLLGAAFDREARDATANQYMHFKPPTWVFYRSGIYNLSDLLGSMDAPLSSAVRASANFPFGFPLVEVRSKRRLWYSLSMADSATMDTTTRLVRLTDGGALSNSGMWPLAPLLVNQRQSVGNNRGVLMIVVDASHMPGAPWIDRQRGLLATIMDKNPMGERLNYQMLETLEAIYGECFGYVYIGIEPQPKYNVYTTWALDRGSLRMVDSAFASAWKSAGPQVRQEYARLQHCDNSRDVPRVRRIHPTRVPLS